MGLGRRLLGVVVSLMVVAGVVAVLVVDDGDESGDVVVLAATRMGEVTSYRTELRVVSIGGGTASPT